MLPTKIARLKERCNSFGERALKKREMANLLKKHIVGCDAEGIVQLIDGASNINNDIVQPFEQTMKLLTANHVMDASERADIKLVNAFEKWVQTVEVMLSHIDSLEKEIDKKLKGLKAATAPADIQFITQAVERCGERCRNHIVDNAKYNEEMRALYALAQ